MFGEEFCKAWWQAYVLSDALRIEVTKSTSIPSYYVFHAVALFGELSELRESYVYNPTAPYLDGLHSIESGAVNTLQRLTRVLLQRVCQEQRRPIKVIDLYLLAREHFRKGRVRDACLAWDQANVLVRFELGK